MHVNKTDMKNVCKIFMSNSDGIKFHKFSLWKIAFYEFLKTFYAYKEYKKEASYKTKFPRHRTSQVRSSRFNWNMYIGNNHVGMGISILNEIGFNADGQNGFGNDTAKCLSSLFIHGVWVIR